jgi:hypothetical protein
MKLNHLIIFDELYHEYFNFDKTLQILGCTLLHGAIYGGMDYGCAKFFWTMMRRELLQPTIKGIWIFTFGHWSDWC